MRIIYQVVGKLEGYERIHYRFDNTTLLDFRLSADAMRKYFGDGTSITYIFPVSLLSRYPDVLRSSSSIEDLVPYMIETFSPQVKFQDFKALVVQSIGDFDGLDFRGDYDDIVLRIFGRMLGDYLAFQPDEVYVDISTGLNLYVSALLEAFRYFIIWVRLYRFGSGNGPVFYRLFAEPYLRDRSKDIYDIHVKKTSARAFFLSPINPIGLDKFGSLTDIHLLRRFLIIFSAIFRNAPLYVFHHGVDEPERVRSEIERLLESISGYTRVYRIHDNSVEFQGKGMRRLYTDLLLSYALYHRISSLIHQIIDRRVFESYPSMGVDMDFLGDSFKKIYELFGLEMNTYLLENELSNLKDRIQYNRKNRAKFELRFLPVRVALNYYQDSESETIKGRNFLAHAGFEGSITLGRIWRNRLYLKYKEGVEREIERILLEIDPTF